MDSGLLKLLVNNEITKKIFFKEVDGTLIFDKAQFNWVIDSKDFLPDSFTAFQNDIMLTDINNNSIKISNDTVLVFPFKDCILEMDSTDDDEKRGKFTYKEISNMTGISESTLYRAIRKFVEK